MKQYEMLLAEIERRKKVLTVLGEGCIVGQRNAAEYNLLCELEEFAKGLTSEPTTSVWHDASETPKMYCKYLIRYADGRVNGSWERHDDGFIPWKDVVKEHKFTHWCYVEDLLKL